MTAHNSKRNRAVLALYGKKSFGLIAKELGISRNVVAGIVFRSIHPPGQRSKVGGGDRGIGRKYAPERLPHPQQQIGGAA